MVGLKSKLLPLAYKDLFDLASAYLSDLLLYQSCCPSFKPSLCTHPSLHLESSSPTCPYGSFGLLEAIKNYLLSKAIHAQAGTLAHHPVLFFSA